MSVFVFWLLLFVILSFLWLLVGTPSAIIPELAFSRVEHSRPYSDVAKYIFDIYSTALAYPNATHSARGKGLASKDLLRNKFTPGAG